MIELPIKIHLNRTRSNDLILRNFVGGETKALSLSLSLSLHISNGKIASKLRAERTYQLRMLMRVR